MRSSCMWECGTAREPTRETLNATGCEVRRSVLNALCCIHYLYRFSKKTKRGVKLLQTTPRSVRSEWSALTRSFFYYLFDWILYTLQDCVLFHDTILHNLHYGDLSKSVEEVYRASKMAELHESVVTWPKGCCSYWYLSICKL